MSAKAMGSATVQFSLISVPVDVFSSTDSKATQGFRMLHGKCGNPVKQQYVCPSDEGEVVASGDIVKGFEVSKGNFVVFSADEVKSLQEEGSGSIEVAEFVPLSSIPREFVDKVYYLGPKKGGDRAYQLLASAMADTGRAALGQYAVRGKLQLVAIRAEGATLVMEQLHYADEVKPMAEVPVPMGVVKPGELDLAKQLVMAKAADAFDAGKFVNTVKDRLLEAVDRKLAGLEIVTEKPVEASAPMDLMAALKASLAQTATV